MYENVLTQNDYYYMVHLYQIQLSSCISHLTSFIFRQRVSSSCYVSGASSSITIKMISFQLYAFHFLLDRETLTDIYYSRQTTYDKTATWSSVELFFLFLPYHPHSYLPFLETIDLVFFLLSICVREIPVFLSSFNINCFCKEVKLQILSTKKKA